MDIDDLDASGGYEDEECRCSKCGKAFYLRQQDTGGIDYDEGYGKCPACYKYFCDVCAQWHSYGDKYKKICTSCFNEEILNDFADWYEIFQEEYCDKQCDNCPFFFKKGCMMILLHDLVDLAFHTEGVKKIEFERVQKKNRKAEKLWESELRNAGVQPKLKQKK